MGEVDAAEDVVVVVVGAGIWVVVCKLDLSIGMTRTHRVLEVGTGWYLMLGVEVEEGISEGIVPGGRRDGVGVGVEVGRGIGIKSASVIWIGIEIDGIEMIVIEIGIGETVIVIGTEIGMGKEIEIGTGSDTERRLPVEMLYYTACIPLRLLLSSLI